MSTAIAILGGIGLFLLGMTVMTDGLKALAGSALRTVLGKAAATPLSGALWGAVVTLLVQSSSAVTMTTIGLVSAGLMTFPQGLGLVFGANVGTTGTGWLVALIGVRVSLSAYALPMIFAGALAKLLGSGRIAASGGALAGFALVLYGLTTLQQGMGGLAETLHPSDLPAVLGMPEVGWAAGSVGLMTLIIVGLAMTAVMQSSTAAIAVTISAYYAGAVGLEQGAALIIGQNIGTATSSALAAIGASATAKRLALAYVLFKVIAAIIAVVAFPLTAALMKAALASVDGMTLLAAYHTAYNVVGVAVLLPATQSFTRVVERLLPSKQTALQRALDPSALASPVVAVETARRVVADVLTTTTTSVSGALSGGARPPAQGTAAAAAALEEVRDFLSELKEPPETEAERHRMTSTLHALDHASRLVEVLADGSLTAQPAGALHDFRAAQLCTKAMRAAQLVGGSITSESALSAQAPPIGWNVSPEVAAALAEVEDAASKLDALQRDYRAATLASVAPGKLTAAEALTRIDAARRLDRIVNHVWRSAAHLLGRGTPDNAEAGPTPSSQPESTAAGRHEDAAS
ncbi:MULTISPECIES: Na/Pi symporter [unclassified Sinorhizobium]|uniref:Na/Pi cotransporter family protein n=1 Tax=unclassified Sinorhizobium TaxID=2613772 RepID=UPI0024C2244E|nr:MULTISPECIES: Na/Pi symporter [unclassified Sinorhizobium]MDK1373392.1 Na/Pi symporter [Sinorhizobium sp. 6-70]MDK1482044.1 Na/Pi symporter [Sinorhizobium sp. 6-117]